MPTLVRRSIAPLFALSLLGLCLSTPALGETKPETGPWLDPAVPVETRVHTAVKAMTQTEKLQLVFGYFSTDAKWMGGGVRRFEYPKDGLPDSAGFVPGAPRLGIPPLWETDAGVGVATQPSENPRLRTALPSGLSTAATWAPDTAYAGGQMIGNEARLSGFNVLLGGSVNLVREPRNGRNFEYAGEDPLLAGVITGHAIKGVQSNRIISTMKHFAFNSQETNRNHIDVQIAESAARQSDLLAFELALEIGNPGSVMCAYNRVNGAYACENDWLLNQVLKTDWGFKGFVMSDWGAVHSTIPAANAGLDQQSGWAFDRSPYFHAALGEAVNNGHVSRARFDDMAGRVLWAMFTHGVVDSPVTGDQSAKIDTARHAQITQAAAEDGIVLLKNNRLLPLAGQAKRIVIIGGHADFGVISGGGSSQVYTTGYKTFEDPWGKAIFYPSSPMAELQNRTEAKVTYHDGVDVKAAARAAKAADMVIVFATQWTAEGMDTPDLNLPGTQNALISAVAAANPRTVVVLQTGGPVVMPWLNKVGAVIQAWYPGSSGGAAIARVLTGEVNPSGRLPVTFPASTAQLPRPKIDGDKALDEHEAPHPHTNYDIEGAAVGYKWYDRNRLTPLFAFGHGLSYTRFDYSALEASTDGSTIKVTFAVQNTGKVAGKDIAQIYVSPAAGGWEAPKRLGAFTKVDLAPDASQTVTLTIDPRLMAEWSPKDRAWKIAAGDYEIILARSADAPEEKVSIRLTERLLND